MRWSVDGANKILTLRCYAESGKWDETIRISIRKLLLKTLSQLIRIRNHNMNRLLNFIK